MINLISKGVESFWSIWPKNFYFLAAMSAFCEALSVTLFKISNSRGPLSIVAYILGILVIAFYAEALRYSKLAQSYPIWLALVAIFITVSSFFILREKVASFWFFGFALTVIGLIIIQYSLPPES